MKKVLFLSRYTRKGASSRLRSFQYIDFFFGQKEQQFIIENYPLLDDEYLAAIYNRKKKNIGAMIRAYLRRFVLLWRRASEFDLIWVEKEVFPYLPSQLELWLLKNKKFVLDYDDAIFHNYDLHHSKLIQLILGKKIGHLMAAAELVFAGNQYIADYAANAGSKQVKIFPTVIDLKRYSTSREASINAVLVIAWIGTPATQKFLNDIHKALKILALNYPYELRLIGAHKDFHLDGVPYKILPWSEEREIELLSQADIGIMPLVDQPFERGKCGYKLIQYMGCGKPVVASPIAINREIVDHGKSGYLAHSQEEWCHYLLDLLKNPDKRKQFGAYGQKKVEEKYSLEIAAKQLECALIKLLDS